VITYANMFLVIMQVRNDKRATR